MPSPPCFPRTAALGAALVILCAGLAPPPASANGRPAPASTAAEPAHDDYLPGLHAAIESAFARCDPSPLKTAFSPRVKTYLASPVFEIPAGYYGADQVLLMLRRWFAGRTTMRFRLDPLESAARADGRHIVAARWQYREEGSSRSNVRLQFTLAPEGPVWYIREIREQK
ncbi:MAG: hypothetical protein AUG09_03845 [Acidobacteria bacterium 13_1_20CM_2_68_7]|nr:MAG: hypothetical protein AUG09_03845 [Acidobacteria bacterium 13_1_20CM_2_68_7]